eukprot:gene5894-6490_t
MMETSDHSLRVRPPMATPTSAYSSCSSSSYPSQMIRGRWEYVECRKGSVAPCQRSLHAGAVWKDHFIVFGGYDGQRRVNDLYLFDFKSSVWTLLSNLNAPSARDRHVAVVHENALYIFGGFDGVARVNDLHAFDLENHEWHQVHATTGEPPTPRHSHAAVVYRDSMFVFGGYDGSYRCDFHAFNFQTRAWRLVVGQGDIPKARYRGTCVVSGDSMILHGGHDGTRHLQDTHIYDFTTNNWSTLVTEGPIPSPRDSHVAVIFNKSMYLYGGSTGSAMGDFHELKLEFRRVWCPVTTSSTHYASHYSSGGGHSPTLAAASTAVMSPGPRFCHVGVVYDGAFYIFGGYDGASRLNDFLRYRLEVDDGLLAATPSTIISDLRKYVNSDLLSDIRFIVEGQPVFAHKILCLRCPYFHNMLTGEYMESRASAVTIPDVKYATFVLLMEYLYTDEVNITMETAMELFQVADRFGIDRLKTLCEQEMLRAIDIESAAHILYTADEHHAENLRERCMNFILLHFDEVSRTTAFEEMGRTNVDLIFEILRRR